MNALMWTSPSELSTKQSQAGNPTGLIHKQTPSTGLPQQYLRFSKDSSRKLQDKY